MKNTISIFIYIVLSTTIYSQITPIEIEYDSIRPLSELNTTDLGEGYPWISNDGLRIYFTQGLGSYNIMFSERNNTTDLFSDPVPLSINIDTIGSISQWVSGDELHIYFFRREHNNNQATTLYHSSRGNKLSDFGAPAKVELLGGLVGYSFGPSLTQDLDQLYIYNSSDSAKILIFEKSGDNEYSIVDKLIVPNGYLPGPGQCSFDGLKFYLSLTLLSDYSQAFYYAERENIEGKFDNFYFIDNEELNEPSTDNIQPCMSTNEDFMVFTRYDSNYWGANDIYIAYNLNPVSVIDQHSQKDNVIEISPNPASDYVNFNYGQIENILTDLDLAIYNSDGKLVDQRKLNSLNTIYSLSTIDYNSGLYFYRINFGNGFFKSGSFMIHN